MSEHVATAPPAVASPFWDATGRDELVLPFCPGCGTARWYPEPGCPACGSLDDPRWAPVPGTGVLFTWTRVHRPFLPATGTPLVIGLVEPDGAPGVRLVAPLDTGGRDPMVGARVTARFRQLGTHTAPVFVPEGGLR